MGLAVSTFHSPSPGNLRTRRASGRGNMFFLRPVFPSTRARDGNSGTILPRILAKRAQTSCERGGHCEAGQLPQFTPLFCDTFALERLRHSNRAGTARPQRREHHDDLYARAEPARNRSKKPTGLNMRDRDGRDRHVAAVTAI